MSKLKNIITGIFFLFYFFYNYFKMWRQTQQNNFIIFVHNCTFLFWYLQFCSFYNISFKSIHLTHYYKYPFDPFKMASLYLSATSQNTSSHDKQPLFHFAIKPNSHFAIKIIWQHRAFAMRNEIKWNRTFQKVLVLLKHVLLFKNKRIQNS